jgi:hypothetical protein
LYDTWAEYEASTGTDADGDGKVSTEAEVEVAPKSKGKLDANTAKELLKEAGGDRDKARELARKRGYTL